FLSELTRLFQKCRVSGSVFITLKKCKQRSTVEGLISTLTSTMSVTVFTGYIFHADDGRTKPIPRKGSVEGFEPADNKCLLRATDGKKKISTV
ncbi:Signal recognition particle 14 kDa protein, partial [Galemys pyrenaicus]